MKADCGCEADSVPGGDWGADAPFVNRKDCRYPALVAEVERLRAFVREHPPKEMSRNGFYCWWCQLCGCGSWMGAATITHEADCLWVACAAIDPKPPGG